MSSKPSKIERKKVQDVGEVSFTTTARQVFPEAEEANLSGSSLDGVFRTSDSSRRAVADRTTMMSERGFARSATSRRDG